MIKVALFHFDYKTGAILLTELEYMKINIAIYQRVQIVKMCEWFSDCFRFFV